MKPSDTAISREQQIEHVVSDLLDEFAELPPAEVRRRVDEGFARVADSRIDTYLSILVHRRVRAEFRRRRPGPGAPGR